MNLVSKDKDMKLDAFEMAKHTDILYHERQNYFYTIQTLLGAIGIVSWGEDLELYLLSIFSIILGLLSTALYLARTYYNSLYLARTYSSRSAVEGLFSTILPRLVQDSLTNNPSIRQNLTQFVSFQLRFLRDEFDPENPQSPSEQIQASLSEKFPAFFTHLAPRYYDKPTDLHRTLWWDECLRLAQPILDELSQLVHLTTRVKEVNEHYQGYLSEYESKMVELEEQYSTKESSLQQTANKEKEFLGAPTVEVQTELDQLAPNKRQEIASLNEWFAEKKQWRDEQISQFN